MGYDEPRQIECLACGELRVVFGRRLEDTGECPRCRYVGWTYAADLDGTTKAMILNGLLAKPPAAEVALAARVEHVAAREASPRLCAWRERHGRLRRRA